MLPCQKPIFWGSCLSGNAMVGNAFNRKRLCQDALSAYVLLGLYAAVFRYTGEKGHCYQPHLPRLQVCLTYQNVSWRNFSLPCVIPFMS
jgi:hypothetical protein